MQTRKASLEQARIDLSRTQIRSPIDGVVIQRSIDLGQTVAASLQAPVLFKIAQDLSQIRIEAKVDEADIGSIKQDDQATFTVDAFPDQSFNGRVAQVRLASTTVQNVVTYSVMIQANNPRQMLMPGMTANVRIVTARRENVLRVPNDAARFQPPEARNAAAGNGGPGCRGLSGRRRWLRGWRRPGRRLQQRPGQGAGPHRGPAEEAARRRARSCSRSCVRSRAAVALPALGGGAPGGSAVVASISTMASSRPCATASRT